MTKRIKLGIVGVLAGALAAATVFVVALGYVSITRVPAMTVWLYDREGHPHNHLRVEIEASRRDRNGSAGAYRVVASGETDGSGRARFEGQTERSWLGPGILVHGAYPPYYYVRRLVLRSERGIAANAPLEEAATVQVMLEREQPLALVLSFYHNDLPLPPLAAERATSVAFLARPAGDHYGTDVAAAVIGTMAPDGAGWGGADYGKGITFYYYTPQYAEVDTYLMDSATGHAVKGYDAHASGRTRSQ